MQLSSGNPPPRGAIRALLTIGFVIFAALAGGCGGAAARSDRPPILLISIDTLRADGVSGFGAPMTSTPILHLLGDQGIRFENAISATHVTAPSHATMLTGFSTFVHGVTMAMRGKGFAIPAEILTIAEILKKNGYATAGFTDGVQLVSSVGFDRGFELYEATPTGLKEKKTRIAEFVERNKDKPFFLFCHTYRPHAPYRPPADLAVELLKNYKGVYAPAVREVMWASHRDMIEPSAKQNKFAKLLSPARAATAEDKQFLKKLYYAGATAASREVGSVLAALEASDIYDKSLIIVTSDHGEELFDHGEVGHSTAYDECLRVPLIMRLPERAGAGRRIKTTFPAVDLVPTILDLAGIEAPYHYEGRSVAPYLLEGEPPERPAFSGWYYSQESRFPGGVAARTRAAKRIQFKEAAEPTLLVKSLMPLAYYDLEADPGEHKNIASDHNSEEHPLAEATESELHRFDAFRYLFHVDETAEAELTPEAIETLNALGYVATRPTHGADGK